MEIPKTLFPIVFLLAVLVGRSECRKAEKVLSRHKRYLTFPEGSSLSVAFCMTAQTGLTPGQIFTEGINWGISYELPNDTSDFKDLVNKPTKSMQRRHRRDLYSKMEIILDSMGYSGKDCILRSLCEASRILRPGERTLIEEILHIVFGYPEPKPDVSSDYQDDLLAGYSSAVTNGRKKATDCQHQFPGCPFSLVQMALGYYGIPYNEPYT